MKGRPNSLQLIAILLAGGSMFMFGHAISALADPPFEILDHWWGMIPFILGGGALVAWYAGSRKANRG